MFVLSLLCEEFGINTPLAVSVTPASARVEAGNTAVGAEAAPAEEEEEEEEADTTAPEEEEEEEEVVVPAVASARKKVSGGWG